MPGSVITGRSTVQPYTHFMKYGVVSSSDMNSSESSTVFKNQFANANMLNLAYSASGFDSNRVLLSWNDEHNQLSTTSIALTNTITLGIYMCTKMTVLDDSDSTASDDEDVWAHRWVKVGEDITLSENHLLSLKGLYAGGYKFIVKSYSGSDTDIRIHCSVFSETIPVSDDTYTVLENSPEAFFLIAPDDSSSS